LSGSLPPNQDELAERAAGASGSSGARAACDCQSRNAPVISRKQEATPARKRNKAISFAKEIRHDRSSP
jgi:hypothetical protein